jgi:hypothetical protein
MAAISAVPTGTGRSVGSVSTPIAAFNRGLISQLALARVDFSRTALSAQEQKNWMPRALGSMMLRPGTEYIEATKANNQSVSLPFVYAIDDTAQLELTNTVMRVLVDDELVTRPAVTTTITNGTFNTDLSGWTDLDGAGAASTWLAGGYMQLAGGVTTAARRRQQVTVSGGNVNVLHALNIIIERGPLLIRVGSTAGGDEYITETTLYTGAHSLAFTPTGDFYIDFFSYNARISLVDSVAVASSGAMELASPWLTADLGAIRWDQSGDVIFAACQGYQQRRIERRPNNSWSIVLYESDNGPFRPQNLGAITITPSSAAGDATLTASAALFRSTHVGALFRLTHTGQSQEVTLTAENQFSDSIRVTGVDSSRIFSVVITGTFTATVTLQYSTDEATWVDAASGSYAVPTAISYDDTFDNQILYYRIGIKTGGYTSGTAVATITISTGSQTGIARITSVTNSTSASAGIIEAFASATATSDWSEGSWSSYRGYPTSVALYEGRLWWAGQDAIYGSVSDSFDNFDPDYEGDAGPIHRSIGSGPVDTIHWLMPLSRLLVGAAGTIRSARSTSLDEPLTPTNFNLKDISGQGASSALPVKIDTSGAYVQRSGVRLYEASYDAERYDYGAGDLTVHVPEVGEPAITRTVLQRQPETRIHCIRSDGTVAILIFDKAEDVKCWVEYETDGDVEDIMVLPGTVEDKVIYTVKRTVNGSTVRYHEKWAMESECVGGTLNKQADSFIAASGSGASITGLSHLEGESVVVWADGEDKGTFVVSSGAVAQAYTTGYVVGLPYTATYKSTKLAYGVPDGRTALTMKKKIVKLGIIAQNMHAQGLQYGPDFTNMQYLPLVDRGAVVDEDYIYSTYDSEPFEFPGDWDTDHRLCLKAAAPRPVTLLAAVINLDTNITT